MTETLRFPDSDTATPADCLQFMRELLIRCDLGSEVPSDNATTDKISIPDVLDASFTPLLDPSIKNGCIFHVMLAGYPELTDKQLRFFIFYQGGRVQQRSVPPSPDTLPIVFLSWENGFRMMLLMIIQLLSFRVAQTSRRMSLLKEELGMLGNKEQQRSREHVATHSS